METRDRSAYPDSPQHGVGNLSDWIVKPYSIVFTAVVFFIIIFGIAFFLSWRQFNDTRNNVLTSDKTTAKLLADLILQHNRATVGILQSYAHRPLFVVAAEKKDLAGIDRHLSDIKKNADIDITFVADKSGILLTNFPVFPESRGKDFSQRDWYKGISAHWKPYISTVFKQIIGDKLLAVTVCVPIFDEKGRPIGILGNSQRLNYIDDTIEKVTFNPYTTVNVIDRVGKILYSNKIPYLEKITDYRFFPILEPALKGKRQQIEMNDPQKDQERRYLTVVPIGDIGWTIIIERSLRDIYRSDLRRFMGIGAVSFLLFLLIIFFLVYLRKVFLFRKTEELLQLEIKLRREEEKLRALSSRQEAILAAVPEIIMEVDNNKVYTWANSVGIEFFGEDVIGKEAAFYFEGEQDTYSTVRPLFNGAKEIIYVESWQRRRDGEKRLLAWWCRVLKDEKGDVDGALSSAYDITERKRAEEEVARVAWEWQATFDATNDAIWILDQDQRVLRSNKTAERFFHRPLCEMIGKHCWEIVHGTKQPIPECPILRVRKSLHREAMDLQEGEQWFEVHVDPILDAAGRYSGAVHIVSDITERKRADQEMALLANIGLVIGSTLEIDKVYDHMAAEIRKLIPFDNLMLNICDARQETLHVAYISGLDMPGRMVGDVFPVQGTLAEAVIRTRKGVLAQSENQEDLINKFPRLIVSVRAGIRSVMSVPLIALDKVIGNLIMRSKKPVAFTEQDLLLAEKIGIQIAGAMANAELFNNLSKTENSLRMSEENYRNLFDNANEAIFVAQDGKLVFINPMTIRLIGHSHDALMSRSFVEFIHPDDRGMVIDRHIRRLTGEDLPHIYSFRIIDRDGKIIWVELNTVVVNWKEKSATLNFLSDVTERKQAEKQLQDTLESLRKAVGTTIQVMVAAVETRDPYTSGHQIRSANLARAIATEMELPSEKIEGIRMAGSIHDIGKLSIPAEILSKPTKLSEIEFSLIKEHAGKGFEMLKDVESPWPLAEIVYQHHERMDGSGYPRNLKGEQILIEARILSVADVVEAMASHRPYRPGLGVAAALEEIEKNSGIFYDSAVSEACLRLFREKGFQIEAI